MVGKNLKSVLECFNVLSAFSFLIEVSVEHVGALVVSLLMLQYLLNVACSSCW